MPMNYQSIPIVLGSFCLLLLSCSEHKTPVEAYIEPVPSENLPPIIDFVPNTTNRTPPSNFKEPVSLIDYLINFSDNPTLSIEYKHPVRKSSSSLVTDRFGTQTSTSSTSGVFLYRWKSPVFLMQIPSNVDISQDHVVISWYEDDTSHSLGLTISGWVITELSYSAKYRKIEGMERRYETTGDIHFHAQDIAVEKVDSNEYALSYLGIDVDRHVDKFGIEKAESFRLSRSFEGWLKIERIGIVSSSPESSFTLVVR